MAATRLAKTRKLWTADATPVTNLTAADASHQEVASPAMLLQGRISAALAVSDGAYAIEPVVDKWSPAIRLAILFGGASASWVFVWQVAKYLI